MKALDFISIMFDSVLHEQFLTRACAATQPTWKRFFNAQAWHKTSPYLYAATAAFTLSACSSDLLSIRLSLTCGFVFLVLASLSGNSIDGSFHDMPLFPTNNDTDSDNDREIRIPMLINACLFVLNFYICTRLVADEKPQKKAEGFRKGSISLLSSTLWPDTPGDSPYFAPR